MKSCCRSMPLYSVVALVLLHWSGVESASTSDCPDQYLYTQQPPQDLFICNPYVRGELSMSCGALGKNITDIQWWFAPDSIEENAIQITESSNYTLVPKNLTEGFQVQLTVNNLGAEDVGTYWCQASVEDMHGVQLLSRSESLKLEEESYFDSQLIDNKCAIVLRNSVIRCASILITPPTVTTTLPEPSLSSTLYPSPSSSPETSTETATQLPTTQTVSATPSGLFQTSSVILYAVLGLVGFLAIACVLLIVIVVVLCRRKCASRDIKSCSEKDAGFDNQFSNQSGYPPAVYKHTDSAHVIHTDTHHRTMSGEYAEIGPALNVSQEYGHSNILRSSLPPIPIEMDPESNQFTNPGYENPYDLLVFPTQTQTAAEADNVALNKSQEKTEGADSQSVRSHEYHMLEQIVPATSDSATPVISPQHTYHTLENSAPPVVTSDDDLDATASAYDDIIRCEPSQRLSCDSASELSRLPTIPENDLEDQRSIEYVNVVQPHHHPSDTVSPDLSNRVDLKDCTGFSESSKDNGEYDRLIDPPHLYHILEHSPSLPGHPRIHSFDMTTAMYSHLEAGHCTKEATQLLPHIHFVSQQTDVRNTSDTYSSESSLEATESNVFDDPQYLVSPPSRTRVVRSACSMRDKLKELQKSQSYVQQYGQPPTLVHKDKTEAHSDSILMKYSGDYERDPIYMQKLYNESKRHSSSHGESSTSVQHPLQVMDDSTWCDDSGFATYGSKFDLQDHERRSSLPNLGKHIYQPLETETMEPVQPYDKLKKSEKEAVM